MLIVPPAYCDAFEFGDKSKPLKAEPPAQRHFIELFQKWRPIFLEQSDPKTRTDHDRQVAETCSRHNGKGSNRIGDPVERLDDPDD